MTDTPIDSELVEVLPDPVLVFKSADLTLLWMNSAAENWLQCSLTSKLGRNLAHIAGGFAALETSVRDVAKNGSTIRGHNLYIRFPGLDSAEVSYLIFPYKDNLAVLLSPEISGLGAGSDSDKGQAVGMFGQMLAHELKNPLAGIYGAVQLLEAGIADAADLEITGLIKSEVKRIGRLADKMEDFGINEPSEFDNFNIHTVLRKALLLFQNSNNADIEFVENYDPSLPDVYGNADKLMQVVINFLANATDSVKANKGSGKIEIQTLYRAGVRKQAPQGGLHALPIEVKITDNGGGVSDKIKDRIFQPFVTGKTNGHGLGLALVSKIIEEHGGIVVCHSNDDETIFSVLLPSGCEEKL